MTWQVKRTFKYRFYPTNEQTAELSLAFSCVRLMYNKALEERTQAWYGEQRRVSYVQRSAALTKWKKAGELSFTFRDGQLTLAKRAGPLDIRGSRALPEGTEPTTVTVSCDAAVGLDTWITSLVTLSTGEKIANPRHERRDHLYKLTTRLVRENQKIAIENLTVRSMVKNHGLARVISDAAWRDMRTMLEYKCAWYGRELVVIDRYFPNSKPCGACGTVTAKLPLNVPQWTCHCGTVHDRDVNAARDIKAAGLAASACGDGVRPQRESSRTGRSSVKQEPQRATTGTPRSQAAEEVKILIKNPDLSRPALPFRRR